MTGFGGVFSRVPGLVVLVALMASVANLPARAQDSHVQRYGEKDKEETSSEKAAKKEAEKAYQRSLGNIPAQKATDPWGIARGDESQPKPAAKPGAPKPKSVKNEAAKTEPKTAGAAKQ